MSKRLQLSELSPTARATLADFNTRAVVQHPKQAAAFDAVCASLDAAWDTRQLTVLYGPPGAGKTMVASRVRRAAVKAFLAGEHDADDIPYLYVLTPAPTRYGSLQLSLFYAKVLEAVDEILIEQKRIVPKVLAPKYPKRTEAALALCVLETVKARRPLVFCMDEAQHLGIHSSASQMHAHLDFLKTFADETGCPLLLVGQYSLVEFGVLSGQLGRRTVDVPLHRYGESAKDQQDWSNIVRFFAKLLPTHGNLDLEQQRDWLYEGSVGCVGILKPWLYHALQRALVARRSGVTLEDLRETAQPQRKVQTQRLEAERGEARIRELDAQQPAVISPAVQTTPTRAVGQRTLQRDPVGEAKETKVA